MKSRSWWWIPVLGAALAACGGGGASGGSGASGSSSSGSGGGSSSSASGGGETACAVFAVLEAKCWSCHGTVPKSSAPMSFVTAAGLTAHSPSYPAMTYAERAVARMKDAKSPMPPGPGSKATASDIAAFEAWIAAGLPEGSCAIADPYAAASKCSSGKTWPINNQEDADMRPGNTCIQCHLDTNAASGDGDAPIFAFAGTLYPGAHEPNECVAEDFDGAKIEVTDANGKVIVVEPGTNGNFFSEDAGFMTPYTAKVIYQGRERAMNAKQKDGDCNGCHTEKGTQEAPGRIMLP